MAELTYADRVIYEGGDRSVEAELDDLRQRMQTQNDLIANLSVRVQALEAKSA